MIGGSISKKKASILNLLFNYGNVIFTIINGLVLLPIYLKYFSVSTYGSFLSSGNVIAMLGLLEGGLSYVLTQKLATTYAQKNYVEFSKIAASGMVISLILSVIIIIISATLCPYIPVWVKAEHGQSQNLQIAFLLSAAGAAMSILFNNLSAIYQSLLRVTISGTANLISILCGVTATLGGLYCNLGIVAIPLGIFIKGLIGVLILSVNLYFWVRHEQLPPITPEKQMCKELFKATIPILGSTFSKSVVTNSQLLIITNFINPSASAIYFITSRIYLLCDSLLAPIGSSIFSSISQIFGEGDTEKLKKSLFQIFIIFSAFSAIILACSISLNQAFITLLLGSEKYGGDLLSALICINMLFYTRNNFLEVNLFALGVFGRTVLYDILTSGLRLACIFVLIKHFGYLAVPAAEMISSTLILSILLNFIIIKKIRLNTTERIRFVTSGWYFFFIAVPIVFFWRSTIPLPSNWFFFIVQATILFTILVVVTIVIAKDIREKLMLLLRGYLFKKHSPRS